MALATPKLGKRGRDLIVHKLQKLQQQGLENEGA